MDDETRGDTIVTTGGAVGAVVEVITAAGLRGLEIAAAVGGADGGAEAAGAACEAACLLYKSDDADDQVAVYISEYAESL